MLTDSERLAVAFGEFRSALTESFPKLLSEIRPAEAFELPYAGLPGCEQICALWRLTNGQPGGRDGVLGLAGGLRLLGPTESERERQGWLDMMDQGEGIHALAHPKWDCSISLDPDSVRAVYYAAAWLPVLAEPYEANYLAVDLDPLPGGRPGQVILCGRDEDEKCVVTPDLAALFHALATECKAGQWSLKRGSTGSGTDSQYLARTQGRLLTSCKERSFPGDQ